MLMYYFSFNRSCEVKYNSKEKHRGTVKDIGALDNVEFYDIYFYKKNVIYNINYIRLINCVCVSV